MSGKLKPGDEIVVGSSCEHGNRMGLCVRDGAELGRGVFRDAVPGQPLQPGHTFVQCEKVAEGRVRVVDTYRHGPPKIATDAYRQGWDSIFGGRQSAGEA